MSDFERKGELNLSSVVACSGVFALTTPSFEHVYDPEDGSQFLVLCEETQYPIGEHDSSGLILDQVSTSDDSNVLMLPDNFVTMAQTLNDTIGNSPSNTTVELSKRLFKRLGYQLSQMSVHDGVLPENIHYRQIIVVKDSKNDGLRLLPPLYLQPSSDHIYSELDTRTMLTHQLFNSCYHGASNKSQKDALPRIFKGFVDAFKVIKVEE